MGWCTRGQLGLLLLLLAAAGAGLGVAHWRAAHPELVERLERLDRDIARSADAEVEEPRAAPRAEARAPRPLGGGESEPRPARARPAKRAVSPSGEQDPPLDLNGATLSDLLRLPGVGPVIARRILEARQDAGRFAAVDDLATVRGLGRAKLERLRPFVGVLE